MRNMEKSRNFKVVTKIKLQVFFFHTPTPAQTTHDDQGSLSSPTRLIKEEKELEWSLNQIYNNGNRKQKYLSLS